MGSHLTRIRRSIEGNKGPLLQSLAEFFAAQQGPLSTALGGEKAGAVISMLDSLAVACKEMHEEIGKAVHSQLAILTHIQEILNIQRQYVAGREDGERQAVNLRAVLTDSLSMLSATMEKRNIRLTSQLPETLTLIPGDRTRLMQVMMNLLKNSIEAMDHNTGEKRIDADLRQEGQALVLRITDNGCGFSGDTGARLFERGFSTKSSGTGLGLYNCREIVESHNGSAGITSEGPGKGAMVTLQFNIRTS
jgi:signal transduction histidine kinase